MKFMTRLSFFFFLLSFGWAGVQADPTPKPKPKAEKPKNIEWTVFEGDVETGSVSFLFVTSPQGTRSRSWKLTPKDKKKVPVMGVYQVRSDGGLFRYRRLRVERLGAGIIAFTKGTKVRIVGKNQRRTPVELETAYHALWDPQAWLTLFDWGPRLKAKTTAARIPIYNVEKGTAGTAELTPAVGKLYEIEGKPLDVTVWTATGLGNAAVDLFVDAQGNLVAVREGVRAVLRKGLTLKAPPKPEVVEVKTAPAAEGAKEGETPKPEVPAQKPETGHGP